MSKKTTTKQKKITKADRARFLSSFILAEIKRLGLDAYDKEDGHWDWEEHEDVSGTYFVNYYAKAEEDFEQFKAALYAVVRRRGWQIDTCAKFGEFEKERRTANRGRRLCYFYIAPAGTWEE